MIPLSEPLFEGNEWKYLKACLDSGWISAAGPLTSQLEKRFSHLLKTEGMVALASGTAALHLALKASHVQEGDLVLVSDYSFIASANVIRYCGADPIFMETHPETWQADPLALSNWLDRHASRQDNTCYHLESGRKIAAMIVVHAYGFPADVMAFSDISNTWNIPWIEDAAGAIGSKIHDQEVGTFAPFGAYSLNGNKILTAGGGGLLACKSKHDETYIRHISRQAKTEGAHYIHDEAGYNYRLPDIMAAVALAQSERLEAFLSRKQEIALQYRHSLPHLHWQKHGPESAPNYWMLAFRTPQKTRILHHLIEQGIQAKEGWYPLHLQPPYRGSLFAGNPANTIDIYNQVVCLPSSVGLKAEELEQVISAIKEID